MCSPRTPSTSRRSSAVAPPAARHSRVRLLAPRASSRIAASSRKRRTTSSRPSARSWRAFGPSSPSSEAMDYAAAETYLLDLELFGMRFGLDRMRRLTTVLGMPQRRFASVHVVGTNGKSSTARTVAAFHALARARVEVAVIEAGLGGRHDATNVIPSKVQVLTGVGLEHTRWLGPTLHHIAEEKLAVVPSHGRLVAPELPPEAEAVAERVVRERAARRVRVDAEAGAALPPLRPA